MNQHAILKMNIDYLVVGGGISGLTSAYYLSRLMPHKKIGIIERTSKIGGQIITERKNGIDFEMGPRCFATRGLAGEALLDLVSRFSWGSGDVYLRIYMRGVYLLMTISES